MVIPHSRPVFAAGVTGICKEMLADQILACGEHTQALEQQIGQSLGLPNTLAVNAGTSALMLAIRALSKGKTNPRIGIPSYVCASLWFAVKAAGAKPILMDCNADLTLDAKQARDISNSLDILVLVHPFGMVEPLAAETFACPVIEDIAQSVGATLNGQKVGTFADICIGSLYATKPWGGAYGGFIASKHAELVEQCGTMINPDGNNLEATYVGHHLLSNVHAALASHRIQYAEDEQKQRQAWAMKYDALFADLAEQGIASPIHSVAHSEGNAFRYLVHCASDVAPIIQAFQSLGIAAARPVQQPLHLSSEQAPPQALPQAKHAWQHSLSLPLLADMSADEFTLMQQGIRTCFAS